MQSKRQFTVLKSTSFDTTDVSKTRLSSTEKTPAKTKITS